MFIGQDAMILSGMYELVFIVMVWPGNKAFEFADIQYECGAPYWLTTVLSPFCNGYLSIGFS